MKQSYLEVTFRNGRPLAAYYYLPRRPGEKSVRTRRVEPGLLIDIAKTGRDWDRNHDAGQVFVGGAESGASRTRVCGSNTR